MLIAIRENHVESLHTFWDITSKLSSFKKNFDLQRAYLMFCLTITFYICYSVRILNSDILIEGGRDSALIYIKSK